MTVLDFTLVGISSTDILAASQVAGLDAMVKTFLYAAIFEIR